MLTHSAWQRLTHGSVDIVDRTIGFGAIALLVPVRRATSVDPNSLLR